MGEDCFFVLPDTEDIEHIRIIVRAMQKNISAKTCNVLVLVAVRAVDAVNGCDECVHFFCVFHIFLLNEFLF